jgi:hypothetical protein
MIEKENLAIGPLFAVTGVSFFFVLAVVLALTGLHKFEKERLEDAFNAKIPADALQVRTEQHELVEGYAKDEAGKVRIPVEQAMELVLEERAAD